MSVFESVLTLIIPLAAVIWSVNIYHQKGLRFLAGWNTMSKEKKEACNKEALCHLYGKCVAFCGIGAFLLLYGSFSDNDYILCIGLGIIVLMVVLTIIIPRIHSKKYRK